MKNKTASSPTESGCAGLSEPVTRKGIVLFTSSIFGLTKGTEVVILDELDNYYRVQPVGDPNKRYIWKEMVREVSSDA